MTSSARTSISDFPRGHEFEPASFTIAPESAAAYRRAVGDGGDYAGTVPPLAVVALALEALQQRITLPEGSLHTGQEVEHLAPVAEGAGITLNGRVAQRSDRQGFVISVIELEAATDAGPAVRARTTIMAPAAGS